MLRCELGVNRGRRVKTHSKGRSVRCYPSDRMGTLTFALSSASFMRL